jgi:hypothetical protein
VGVSGDEPGKVSEGGDVATAPYSVMDIVSNSAPEVLRLFWKVLSGLLLLRVDNRCMKAVPEEEDLWEYLRTSHWGEGAAGPTGALGANRFTGPRGFNGPQDPVNIM